MSTTIFNGYKLDTVNLNLIQQVNDDLKAMISDLVERRIYALCVNSFIDYKLALLKNPELSFWDYFEYGYDVDHDESLFAKKIFSEKLRVSSFFVQHLDMIEICSTHNLNFALNFRANIFFKSYKNSTYYIMSGGPAIADDFFSHRTDFSKIDNLISYNYWDSTDKPDDISTLAWNTRRKNWDNVFKYKPELEMNQLVVSPLNMLVKIIKKDSKEKDKIFDLIPNDNELLIKFYKKIVTPIYFQEEKAISDNNVWDRVDARLSDAIVRGFHHTYAQKAIDAGFTQKSVLDNLFDFKIFPPSR